MKPTDGIGARIRERRTGNALSQSELGERVGVAQATVSLWEQRKAKPTEAQIQKLEEILGALDPAPDSVTEAESQTPISAWLSKSQAKKNLTVAELAAQSNLSMATIYNVLSGRAQNPDKKTIAALEKALGINFEPKQETEIPAIAGIGELIDFNPYDPKDVPSKAGVYVLYDISQRPIYVGQASKIAGRLNDHSTRFWFKRPLVETAAYIEIPDRVLRDQIETVLIQFLKNNAVINKQKTVRDDD